MNIQSKINGIKTIINKGLSCMDSPYVSCSFGKDSVVMLYYILQSNKQIPVVYINSGYSLPEIQEFKENLIKTWNINFIEIKQNIDYLEFCHIVGLPHERTDIEQKKAVEELKKKKFNAFAKFYHFDGCFWGIRADESRARKNMIRFKGTCFKDKEFWRCSPLAHVNNYELWEIIRYEKIPYCSLYDKNKILKKEEIRNSGWVSTDGAEKGKILHLKYYYPELYNKLEAHFPKIRSYL